MDIFKKHLTERNKVMDEQTLCKKCYLKKHKLSKKNIERMVMSNWKEECDCCHKIDKIVLDIEEDD